MKTNEQLQLDVMDELKWDPLIAASEIGVSAKDGVIPDYSLALLLRAETASKSVASLPFSASP